MPGDVAVVAIDDVTFSDLERQWPFPRSLMGRAVERLGQAGAREIVIDVQYTEKSTDREDLALYDAIGNAGGAVLATTETDGAAARASSAARSAWRRSARRPPRPTSRTRPAA